MNKVKEKPSNDYICSFIDMERAKRTWSEEDKELMITALSERVLEIGQSISHLAHYGPQRDAFITSLFYIDTSDHDIHPASHMFTLARDYCFFTFVTPNVFVAGGPSLIVPRLLILRTFRP